MSLEHLDCLFHPESVAVVGASDEPATVGAVLARNLLHSGFRGPVLPVNPEHRAVQGVLAYPDVASLPLVPDLAVVATPAQTVPPLVAELGERGTRAVIVISAGFGETGAAGGELRAALLDAARPHGVRLLGPNCLGLMVPESHLNASFAHLSPASGDLAFVSQSGAVLTAVLDWAAPRQVGFSHLVSLGNAADLHFADLLDYLCLERQTRAILLYLEGVTDARAFLSAARAAARSKPVVVVKGGRRPGGAEAAASHTGALAGSSAVYAAAFRRAGLLQVGELDELFDVAEALRAGVAAGGNRLAILTNGGGLGVLAADCLLERGGRLAELGPRCRGRLDELLPAAWSGGNPVDIVGDAPPERYARAAELLLASEDADGVLVLNAPTAVTSSADAARAVAEVAKAGRKPVIAAWVGDRSGAEGRRLLTAAGVPAYPSASAAIGAFLRLDEHRRLGEVLRQVPPSLPEEPPPDREAAEALLEAARDEGREWLDAWESKQVLRAYGIPVVETRRAADPEEAEEAARRLEGPLALKILSPDLPHKADAGGVRLGLPSPAAVREAAEEMRDRLAREHPDARLRGFSLEPMADLSTSFELIVGLASDPVFGPVVLFGHGGPEVEVVDDRALALPPLNRALARDLMARTRIHRRLTGYRNRPPADLEGVARVLVRVAQLAADLPGVGELDVNPLLAGPDGVLALDARVRLAPAEEATADRLAIRPYPQELEEWVEVGGERLLLRPVRPEDEPAFRELVDGLSAEERRRRFFAAKRELPPSLAARLTQIDYDRELALVLTDGRPPGEARLFAAARVVADRRRPVGHFALLVQGERTGKGIGTLLLERLADCARRRGLGALEGEVLQENRAMRRLCRRLGFVETFEPRSGAVRVTLELEPGGSRSGQSQT